MARDRGVPRVPGELAQHAGLKPTAPPASPDYDLGFDAQLWYLCSDAQRFAALAAATESFAPCVGPKWTYIGFPCVAWTTRAPGR